MSDNNYISLRSICQRYDVTRMTIHRWMKRPDMGFPQPLTINGRSYFKADEIARWERLRAAGKAVA